MTTAPLSVLHLSGRPAWCGESNRVLVLCRGLRDRGATVSLGAPAASALAQRAAAEGIPVESRFRFVRGFRPGPFLADVRALRRLQRERAFDVVHLHTARDTWPAAIAFGARTRGRRPALLRTRHHSLPSGSDPAHRWLYGRVLDHVVLAADALREPVAGLFRAGALDDRRVTTIHSAIDPRRFDPSRVSGADVRREFGIGDRFCIGLVGRLSREKGHDLLLRALPDILRAEPRAVCLFAGTGDQEERLREEVARMGLADHVVFAGFRDDIPECIAAMDVLVVPSLSLEASPAVVKEGMAMNRPVIASDVGGVSEILRHGIDGWVIPPGEMSALRDALVRLVRDPATRMAAGKEARTRIVERFSDARLVDQTLALYRRLVERP